MEFHPGCRGYTSVLQSRAVIQGDFSLLEEQQQGDSLIFVCALLGKLNAS
jgi:hypothetical protein